MTRPTTERDTPASSIFVIMRGSTNSDEDVLRILKTREQRFSCT